jgi:hypothetical protein
MMDAGSGTVVANAGGAEPTVIETVAPGGPKIKGKVPRDAPIPANVAPDIVNEPAIGSPEM